MNKRGIEVYKNLKKNPLVKVPEKFDFKFSFDYGPKVDMIGNSHRIHKTIKFKDLTTGDYVYTGDMTPGLFTTLFRKWFTPWIVEAYDGDKLVWEFDFEKTLPNQKIIISFDSSSLGDTLAWLPVVELFREKFSADVYVTTFWNSLVSHFFPKLRFLHPGFRDPNIKFVFGVGWYEEEDRNVHKRDPRSISLQQVAGDILGITFDKDVLPPQIPTWLPASSRPIEKKYVCIGTESTANAKHWHHPGGWQILVNHLKSIGYEVMVIHSQQNTLEGVIDQTGEIDMLDRMIQLYHADFFIGIGSGLSWLAWALRKPVVMISGFSSPTCEFSTSNYRVINTDVCHGCFNDVRHKFDRGDWNWCPRLKNTERMFECTTKIHPEQVIFKIEQLILEQKLMTLE